MALTVSATRLIRVAEGTIWRRWHALAAWPEWRPEIDASGWQHDATPWAPDGRFEVVRRAPLPGRATRRFVGVVRSVVTEQLLVYELTPSTAPWLGPTLVESVRLEPAPSGTSVLLRLSAHGVAPTLGAFLLRGRLQRQLEGTLDGLHRLLASAERRL